MGQGKQTTLSYNTRLAAVKLLLEEDDEVVAPWYLHGWLNYLRDDPDYHGNVRHYLSRARQVLVMNPTDDEAMVQHIEELLAEVGEETIATPAVEDTLEYTEENSDRAERIAEILDSEKQEEEEEA